MFVGTLRLGTKLPQSAVRSPQSAVRSPQLGCQRARGASEKQGCFSPPVALVGTRCARPRLSIDSPARPRAARPYPHFFPRQTDLHPRWKGILLRRPDILPAFPDVLLPRNGILPPQMDILPRRMDALLPLPGVLFRLPEAFPAFPDTHWRLPDALISLQVS